MEGVYAPDLKVALRNSPEVSLVDLCINFFLADDSRATLLIDVENRRPLPCLVFSPMLAQRVFRQCKVSSAIDSYLPLFSVPEQVPLNGVIDIPHSSVSCLFPLSSQEVYFLNCAYCSNISIDHVQECFNNSTKSLTHLNLEALTSELKTKIEIWLGKCTNLEHLTLGCTNLSYSSIARDTLPYLQNLRHLDLSEIQITDDMDVLLQLSNSLTSLVLHNVDPHQGILVERRFNNIFKLKKLQNLDISYSKSDGISISYGIDNLLLNLAIDLPDLVSLDLSGTVVADEQVNRSLLQLYLKRRPQTVDSVIPALQVLQAPLEFLGLLNCNAALLQKIPAKAVTGTSNERQLLENFKRYRTRKPFILETFHSLYQLLRDKVITRPVDFLHHIIDCMKLYITAIDIQVSGSASLYHLSSDDNYKTKLNVLHKNAIIEQCVMSMRTHKLHDGMQRNGCLVMFNFDVPDSLEFVYDEIIEQLLHTIEKMTTNVSRIAIHLLNAMMGHADRKHKLRAERLQVIKVLVAAINSRFERQEHDELIDHAWSSLWNLTDETEINCQMFINLDGINLFLKCYHAFRFHEDLSRNMLGCLGNVAEVKSLRKHMLNEDCLNVFIQLLKPYSQGVRIQLHPSLLRRPPGAKLNHGALEISYNACGILAHLMSDDEEEWVLRCLPRDDVKKEMFNAILSWDHLGERNINYRSFLPILRLLQPHQCDLMEMESQLWAVWALFNLCTVYPHKYVHMLIQEDGIPILEKVMERSEPHTELMTHSQMLFNILNGYLHNETGGIDPPPDA